MASREFNYLLGAANDGVIEQVDGLLMGWAMGVDGLVVLGGFLVRRPEWGRVGGRGGVRGIDNGVAI